MPVRHRTFPRLDHRLGRAEEEAQLLLKGLKLHTLRLKVLRVAKPHTDRSAAARPTPQPAAQPKQGTRTTSFSTGLTNVYCACDITVVKPDRKTFLMSVFLFGIQIGLKKAFILGTLPAFSNASI